MRTKIFCGVLLAFVLLLGLSLSAFATAYPVVSTIQPAKGLDSQSVNVTITGAKFHQKTIKAKLTKDGQPDIEATDLVYISKEQITCSFDLKGKALGQWNLVVSNTGTFTKKEKVTVLDNAFTIDPTLPVITSIDPNQAFNNETVTLTIKGDYYQSGAQVSLVYGKNVVYPMNTVFVSANELQVKFSLNGTPAGEYDLEIVNPNGRKGIAPKGFLVKQAPLAVYSVEPNSAKTNTNVSLTFYGFGFDKDMTIRLKQNSKIVPATNVETVSISEAKAKFNLTSVEPGVYDVEINNSKGETAKLAGAFAILKGDDVQVIAPTAPVQDDPNSKFVSIFFDFDKYDLRTDQQQPLWDNLKILVDNLKDGYLILGGHADERGPSDYNLNLSANRADTIKSILVAHGIDAKKIIIYAYGEEFPAKAGHNEESWSYNRRVDFAIWQKLPTKQEALKK